VTVRRYEARVDPTILIPTREEMEPLFSALFDDLDESTTMDLVGHELEERFDAVLRQRGMVFETLAQNKVSTVRMRTQLRPAPSRGEVQGVQRWRACPHAQPGCPHPWGATSCTRKAAPLTTADLRLSQKAWALTSLRSTLRWLEWTPPRNPHWPASADSVCIYDAAEGLGFADREGGWFLASWLCLYYDYLSVREGYQLYSFTRRLGSHLGSG